MKVRAIKDYNDKELNKLIKIGEELEVTDARGAILINAEVAVKLSSVPPAADDGEQATTADDGEQATATEDEEKLKRKTTKKKES